MDPLRALARLKAIDPTPTDDPGRQALWDALVAVDQAREQLQGNPAYQGLCRRVVAAIGHQPELLDLALAERRRRRDPETLRRFQWALRGVVTAGLPVSGRPDPDDVDALQTGGDLLRLFGRARDGEAWYPTIERPSRERRAADALRQLLAEYPEPVDEAERRELRDRLCDLHEVRERFRESLLIQALAVEVLARAGRQETLLIDALAERREGRSPAALIRLRWAVRAVVEARLPVVDRPDPDDVAALVEGGLELGDLGRLEDAADWFDRALAARPDHHEARALGLWIRWLLTMEPAHREALASLSAEHPENRLLTDLLGRTLG